MGLGISNKDSVSYCFTGDYTSGTREAPPWSLFLLLPEPPRSFFVGEILTDHGVTVATYEDCDPPIFSREFLDLCRV
jgi:hypothetical protein